MLHATTCQAVPRIAAITTMTHSPAILRSSPRPWVTLLAISSPIETAGPPRSFISYRSTSAELLDLGIQEVQFLLQHLAIAIIAALLHLLLDAHAVHLQGVMRTCLLLVLL